VLINEKVAKPGMEVKEGDIIQIRFGENIRRYEVISVKEHVSKGEATGMYREL
jgi:ribosomal 50S subunit-recycling heat shock protein